MSVQFTQKVKGKKLTAHKRGNKKLITSSKTFFTGHMLIFSEKNIRVYMRFGKIQIYTCTGLKCVQKGRCQDVDDNFGGVKVTSGHRGASCMLFISFANCPQ